jgi:hypothetical protein
LNNDIDLLDTLHTELFAYNNIKQKLRALNCESAEYKTVAVNSVAATFATANGTRPKRFRQVLAPQ